MALLILVILALAGTALGAVGLVVVLRNGGIDRRASLGWALTALGCGGAALAGLALLA